MENQINMHVSYNELNNLSLGLPEVKLLFQKGIITVNSVQEYILEHRDRLHVPENIIINSLISSNSEETINQIFNLDNSNPNLDQIFYILIELIQSLNEPLNDSLKKIENIYSEFNHPSDLAPFIGYMPEDDSLRGNIRTKEDLQLRIQDYLFKKHLFNRI